MFDFDRDSRYDSKDFQCEHEGCDLRPSVDLVAGGCWCAEHVPDYLFDDEEATLRFFSDVIEAESETLHRRFEAYMKAQFEKGVTYRRPR